VRILILASNYPHAGHSFSGIFNERCAAALREICEKVEVIVPRPYVPSILASFVSRWQVYAQIPPYEVRNGIPVNRPAYLQIPWLGKVLSFDRSAYLFSRHAAMEMHRRIQFDAILSFGLEAGGLAWRLGKVLNIPACGWATGGDVRVPAASSSGRIVINTLKHLDLIFYQSSELLEKAAELLGTSPDRMPYGRHTVLPRGIPIPPVLQSKQIRNRVRSALGIPDAHTLVLSVGRICREKGVYELLQAVALAVRQNPQITCLLVGAMPALDETPMVQKAVNQVAELRNRVRILPACDPERIWEYLHAADIFAFTSHREGMPNSLLEAMAAGVPSVAFSIPAVLELEAQTGALLLVPPFDVASFADAILRLAASPEERLHLAARGKTRVADGFVVEKNMTKAVQLIAQVVQRKKESLFMEKSINGCSQREEY